MERAMASVATQGVREQLLQQWNDLGAKTRALGDALPAASFDEAPAEGVRSAAEVLRHLAFWNGWLAAKLRGEEPDGAANELPRQAAPSRSKALAAFSESVVEAAAALAARGSGPKGGGELDADGAALCASMLGHSAEHYGQLVVYARLDGVVPPASR
jgi:uncharacterized damage-inducible protein DinB